MLRRRRITVAAAAVLACGPLALTACTGGATATDDDSTNSSAASTSPGKSSSSSSPTSEPASTSTTSDPHEIDCTIIPRPQIERWTKGGAPATLGEPEEGCRVVSSSEDGAVIIQWRYLDVVGTNDDAQALREHAKTSVPVTVAPGIHGTRAESDVAPTRTARVIARTENRTMLIETTVTLDREQSLQDMRRITKDVVMAYAKA